MIKVLSDVDTSSRLRIWYSEKFPDRITLEIRNGISTEWSSIDVSIHDFIESMKEIEICLQKNTT